MPERLQLARNWLPRYTGMRLDEFGDYVLLTNFRYYLTAFAETFGCDISGENKPMQAATNDAGLMTRPAWALNHRLPAYSDCPRMELPVAESLESRIVNIPSSAQLATEFGK